MRLLIATSNKGKFIELSDPLSCLTLKILSLERFPGIPVPRESGQSCEENATLKAKHYHEHTGLPTLADDSGIVVEALGDELGLHTRRWGAGAMASDQEWITFFLKRMEHEPNKRACFVCHLAFIDGKKNVHTFEGTCWGVITESLEATYLPGLPISACFKPDGYKCVFSALSIEQKNSTSHRGKAVQKFKEFLTYPLSQRERKCLLLLGEG